MDGDIHLNSGPDNIFLFMHWNVNSLPAHDFARIRQINAYKSNYNVHLVTISETALSSTTSNDEIKIEGYEPTRCDLPNNDTHGGVLIDHSIDLSVKYRSDLCDIDNTIVLEVSISRKRVYFLFRTEISARRAMIFSSIRLN